jgi:hypothetical protein
MGFQFFFFFFLFFSALTHRHLPKKTKKKKTHTLTQTTQTHAILLRSAKEWKETARRQDQEMAKRVAEMERRAREGPYLFERVAMESAKATAMKKFDRVMAEQGIDASVYADTGDADNGDGDR